MPLHRFGPSAARAALLVALVLGGLTAPQLTPAAHAATSCAEGFGYTANYQAGTISKTDLRVNKVVQTIGGFNNPWAVELNSDGSKLYIDDVAPELSGLPDHILVMDTCTNAILKTIPHNGPGYEQVSPDHKWLYAPNLIRQGIQVIDMATGDVVRTYDTTLAPQGGVSSDQKTMWVAALPNLVYPIDMATGAIGAPVDTGLAPLQFTMSPDGHTIAVSDASDRVAFIDTVQRKLVGETHTGPLSQPAISAFTPDNKKILVGGYSGTITAIDVATHKIDKQWNLGAASFGTAISKDGKTAYVTTTPTGTVPPGLGFPYTLINLYKVLPPQGGLVRMYDTTTWKEIGNFPVGDIPIGLALLNY